MNKSRVRNFIKEAAETSILDSKEDFDDEYFQQESRVRSNTTLASNKVQIQKNRPLKNLIQSARSKIKSRYIGSKEINSM